jgi:outer membrane protein OmpA-like peptidoglycan-associated protein
MPSRQPVLDASAPTIKSFRRGLASLNVFALLLLARCVQTEWRGAASGQTETLQTADQTMDVELTDRINRFERLASMQGVTPPQIEEVTIPQGDIPGADRPIPVIRVTFLERGFFLPDSAMPEPAASEILKVVADNMSRDVPDVRVTVLGHTDSSGSPEANTALSQDRALNVVKALTAAGVNPGQLSVVAIGDAQPIAPNSTSSGRALNRRVEFLISPSEQANLLVVSLRSVDPANLVMGGLPVASARRRVAVLEPAYSGPSDFSEGPATPGGTQPAATSSGHSRSTSRLTLAASGPGLVVGEDDSGSPVTTGATTSLLSGSTGPADTGSPVGAAASF